MTENKFKLTIPTSNNEQIELPLTEGNALFVLGANGVGKSTLMHRLFTQNKNQVKRILAHRQTWFTDNAMNITASQKKNTERNIDYFDSNLESRWKDDYSQIRTSLSIFDLINSENIRARNIAAAVDENNIDLAKEHSRNQAPIQAINELLAISNIPINIVLGKDEQLFASKNGNNPYSIAELSDGERNALLIGADVLTAEQNSLILIDEPERHLHRSIISPLLTTLFNKRPDCAFVISTHDVYLPIDHPNSSVLLLRNCQWNGNCIENWDADLIPSNDSIPESIKVDILGSKRTLLFVEGKSSSLDRQIYQLIYPNVSVIPQESCGQVEKAVIGIKQTENLHWVNAFGLIDADDRTSTQIDELLTKGIAALPYYSVEALYYHLHIIEKVSKKMSELTGKDSATIYQKGTETIIQDITPHKERLCARLCEKRIRNSIVSSLPKHKDIQDKNSFKLTLDLKAEMEKEEACFDGFIKDNNFSELLARYPVRETPILSNILKGLSLSKSDYENIVRKLIIDDSTVRDFYRNLLNPLTDIIG